MHFHHKSNQKVAFLCNSQARKKRPWQSQKKKEPIPSARCVLKMQATQCTKDVFVFFRNALCKEVRLSNRGEPNSKKETRIKILDNASAQCHKTVHLCILLTLSLDVIVPENRDSQVPPPQEEKKLHKALNQSQQVTRNYLFIL